MKDFPVFTTEYGAASLVLREIPYLQNAYITVQHSLEPEKLLEECVSFCRACGAEGIYATGHAYLQKYPLHTAMLRLHRDVAGLPDTDAALWPVQAHTLEHWRSIYNEKVRRFPNGAWMTEADGAEMLKKGDGYFVHRGDILLGIGKASGGEIDWVAAVEPGAGREVVLALIHALTEPVCSLTAASANEKAMKLYESMGFLPVQEISRWYKVM